MVDGMHWVKHMGPIFAAKPGDTCQSSSHLCVGPCPHWCQGVPSTLITRIPLGSYFFPQKHSPSQPQDLWGWLVRWDLRYNFLAWKPKHFGESGLFFPPSCTTYQRTKVWNPYNAELPVKTSPLSPKGIWDIFFWTAKTLQSTMIAPFCKIKAVDLKPWIMNRKHWLNW